MINFGKPRDKSSLLKHAANNSCCVGRSFPASQQQYTTSDSSSEIEWSDPSFNVPVFKDEVAAENINEYLSPKCYLQTSVAMQAM